MEEYIEPDYDEGNDSEFCIVGNIVDKHFYGEEKEVKSGTKHFRPNAKVYCFPEFGGAAHENMLVIGQPRKSRKLIKVVILTKRIKNFRLKAIYKPSILGHIRVCGFYNHWKEGRENREDINRFIDYLN
ncbi:MAG: hypothetical protein AAFR36_27725, partial [Bacteroidota bacterium]